MEGPTLIYSFQHFPPSIGNLWFSAYRNSICSMHITIINDSHGMLHLQTGLLLATHVLFVKNFIQSPGKTQSINMEHFRTQKVVRCLILISSIHLGFSGGSAGKESACNAGDLGSIPGLGRSPREGTVTHSSILAYRIPWMVQSMGSQRVRNN